eukprot:CAMPEP_0174250918 /NCGR_PEP_ID=MMETSP0439-20130205/923_1 /TAXON_ID=0 /ORGANISM="Stereomyxa ramosa, Strain Chinc5" /LENGTH=1178 /DNA_ID=CAMNT_0015331101 /DNA_START=286 /DNA_END=3822 /DNA_ORIENTATION=+
MEASVSTIERNTSQEDLRSQAKEMAAKRFNSQAKVLSKLGASHKTALNYSNPNIPFRTPRENEASRNELNSFSAAFMGNLSRLKELVMTYSQANERDPNGYTPLHCAAKGGSLGCLMYLTKMGAEVAYQDRKGHSPLHNAAFVGNLPCAQELVKLGADLNMTDSFGATPLHYAALFACDTQEPDLRFIKQLSPRSEPGEGMVELFLAKGARVDIRSAGGAYPLHHAALSGNAIACKALLDNNAAVDVVDFEGATPLHKAAKNSGECVELLLARGANPMRRDIDKATPLHHAAKGGCVPAIELLVDLKVPIDCKDFQQATPLHVASFHGNDKAVKRLLELGSSPESLDRKGSTPLHKACYNGHLKCAKLLLDHVKNVVDYADLKDSSGATALHKAAFKGKMKIVQLLCSNEADPNATDNNGEIPLHKAAFSGHTECLEFFLNLQKEKGAEKTVVVDFLDNDGCTALHKASFKGRVGCVHILLEHGSNFHIKDKYGGTALHNACYSGRVMCVTKLIEAEKEEVKKKEGRAEGTKVGKRVFSMHVTDTTQLIPSKDSGSCEIRSSIGGLPLLPLPAVNAVDLALYSPLHVACSVGSFDCAQLLLEQGAAVNATNDDGRTPLYYAIRGGYKELARALIMCGAEVNVIDKKLGCSIVDIQSHFSRAIPPDFIMAVVHERDNPVAERLDISSLSPEQTAKLQAVIELFNKKPKKGMALLFEEKLMANNPEAIAHFLFTTPKLDQGQVGEFISDPDNGELLDAYCMRYDFKDLEFDMAIRRFLRSSFKLPGESQRIDRIMEAFAKRYFLTNTANCFPNQDAVYMLSFAAIMLNTDAHKLAKKARMTCEQFLDNCRGIDVPKDFLVEVYNNIVNNEIKMKTDAGDSWDANKKGWLVKKVGRNSYKSLWFILDENRLLYFKNQRTVSSAPLGAIHLENCRVDQETGRGKTKYGIRIRSVDPNDGVRTSRMTNKGGKWVTKNVSVNEYIFLGAASKRQQQSWHTHLQNSVEKQHYADAQKRKLELENVNGDNTKLGNKRDQSPSPLGSPRFIIDPLDESDRAATKRVSLSFTDPGVEHRGRHSYEGGFRKSGEVTKSNLAKCQIKSAPESRSVIVKSVHKKREKRTASGNNLRELAEPRLPRLEIRGKDGHPSYSQIVSKSERTNSTGTRNGVSESLPYSAREKSSDM